VCFFGAKAENMPAVLRRLASEAGSDGYPSDSGSGFETPPKRRRLNIVSTPATTLFSYDTKLVSEATVNEEAPFKDSCWTLEDFASSTPSRLAGISEKEERQLRMKISNVARSILRGLLGQDSTASPAVQLTRLRAQALACHNVQRFFMSASLSAEDADVVSLAACLLALKDLSVLCCVDDLIRVYAEQHQQEEDSARVQRVSCEKVLEVEARMASLARQAFDAASCLGSRPILPLDFVKEAVNDMVGQLPLFQAFRDCCAKRDPAKAARSLKPRLLEAAQRFAVDAMQGPASVVLRPVVVARAVAAISGRYLLQQLQCEVTADQLMNCFVEVQAPPSACIDACGLQELRCATREVFGTYKLWSEQQKQLCR